MLKIEPQNPRRGTSILPTPQAVFLIAEPSPVHPNFNCNAKPKLIANEAGAQKELKECFVRNLKYFDLVFI